MFKYIVTCEDSLIPDRVSIPEVHVKFSVGLTGNRRQVIHVSTGLTNMYTNMYIRCRTNARYMIYFQWRKLESYLVSMQFVTSYMASSSPTPVPENTEIFEGVVHWRWYLQFAGILVSKGKHFSMVVLQGGASRWWLLRIWVLMRVSPIHDKGLSVIIY